MIIIRMTGGMGNQMFQYALYLKLKALQKNVKLDDQTEYAGEDTRPIMLWAFDASYEAATREEINLVTDGNRNILHRIRRKLRGRQSLEYEEKPFCYDHQVLQKDPAYLTGYFQSEKYFADMIPQIRKAFHFTPKLWDKLSKPLREQMQGYLAQIDSSIAVAVHIRRGDYLDNPQLYGNICTEKYYKSAVDLIQEKHPDALFVIFSNDIAWTRTKVEELYGTNAPYMIIEGTTEDSGYLDMLLMSHCKHHIIANSSFSWWGAWLPQTQDKLVIAPAQWNHRAEVEDIYTENMIRITAEGEISHGNSPRIIP